MKYTEAIRTLWVGIPDQQVNDVLLEFLEEDPERLAEYTGLSRDFDGYLRVFSAVHSFELSEEHNSTVTALVLPAVAYESAYRSFVQDQVDNNRYNFNRSFVVYEAIKKLN